MKHGTLTTREAQVALRVSRRRLMALLADGKLPGSYKLGLLWQIPWAAIEVRRQELAKFYRTRHKHIRQKLAAEAERIIRVKGMQ